MKTTAGDFERTFLDVEIGLISRSMASCCQHKRADGKRPTRIDAKHVLRGFANSHVARPCSRDPALFS